MEKENAKKEIWSTLFVALFLSTEAINLIVTRIFFVGASFMSLFYAFTGIAAVVFAVISKDRQFQKTNISHMLAVFTLLLYFLITLLSLKGSTLKLSSYIVLVMFPLCAPLVLRVDIQLLLKITIIVSSAGILRLSNVLQVSNRGALSMGECYAILIPVISTITYVMVFFFRDSKRTRAFLSPFILINMIYLLRIVMYGSRGPILCALLCALFLLIFRRDIVKYDAKRIGKVVVFSVIILFVFENFWYVLALVSNITNRLGINIQAIDKIYRLHKNSSVWNGRERIFFTAVEGIKQHPLLGHGMSMFQQNTGYVYPHNFILQVLYDGGAVLFFTLLWPIFPGIYRTIRHGDIRDIALFAFVFFSSVPGAMMSGDCWKRPCLWFMVGLFLARRLPQEGGNCTEIVDSVNSMNRYKVTNY